MNNKIAYIVGIEKEISNLDHFSFDYMISGSWDTKGNCKAGLVFFHVDKLISGNFRVGQVKGKVKS